MPPRNLWHTYSTTETIQRLSSDATEGLTLATIPERQAAAGPNELQEEQGRNRIEIFWDQFKNVMLLMLIGVALISGVMDLIHWRTQGLSPGEIPFKDTIAILLIVILNGLLGYIQEVRAEKALAALKKLSAPSVQVIRDGQRQEISAKELVPGDVMLIETGTQISADGRILEAFNLQVREAALTGEATVTNKLDTPEGLPNETSLGDRINMAFMGTEVTGGRGKVLVTSTGMTTELGKIAALLQSVHAEPTPLQKRMDHLGKVLVSGSLILVALTIGIGLLQSGWGQLQNLVEVSLSMAVAVVPEGLPAVITVTLAIGTQRMVKRQALIRKLPAVETLGSVSAICSDKTGTLTQNKMVVQTVHIPSAEIQVQGNGYEPAGDFLVKDQTIQSTDYGEFQALLMASILCNDAALARPTDSEPAADWSVVGDPTEGALLVLGEKANLPQESVTQRLKRVGEIPFTSDRKRMSVICQDVFAKNGASDSYMLFTKGSPELVLAECRFYQWKDQTLEVTAEFRRKLLSANDRLAAQGLRNLGIAFRPLDSLPVDSLTDCETQLTWLGLVGMMDTPRPTVTAAIAKCRQAGIRPIMITGDHQLTAQAIAKMIGLMPNDGLVLTGAELEKMPQPKLENLVGSVSVYARVSPEHKLRIVKALQSQGCFVAMTGDGVNDAPALKQSDIGIAMGITGTDVTKDASDMILLDDNFATIVAATEEGRVVYSNIRRFIKYILGSNIGEVITVASAPFLGLDEVPLIPLQILWMNLVTDGLPALALAVEPAEANIMTRTPYRPEESIFARGLGNYIVRIGFVFAILSISLMLIAQWHSQTTGQENSWKTMVFTTLCLSQMGHALAVRSDRPLFQINFFSNPYLLAAVGLTSLLQLMLIYVPPLQNFFNTEPLSPLAMLICIGFSSLLFVWVELEKLFMIWLGKKR
ncbi:MAG: cation-translocating P-type ATPase [Cyanobacteria bacterium P01_H01_bin.15]